MNYFLLESRCSVIITDEYIREYINMHVQEEHDYSFATDERNYDLCLHCDCIRYSDSKEWVIA